MGRVWQSPPGSSLLASILLEPEPVPFLAVARVALAAGEACAAVAGVDVTLKWPNDLMVGHRKLAGLLAEKDDGIPGIVVGIGCNIDWPPPAELPVELADRVVALSYLCPAALVPCPAGLLDGILARLDGWLLLPGGVVLDAYRARCATLGQRVRVTGIDRHFEGTASGITAAGELEVTVGDISEVVSAGDVVHVHGA